MNKRNIQQAELTRKKIYDAMVHYTQEHLYPPSVRDIMELTGIPSSSTVYNQLVKMKSKGIIQMEENKTRCIKLLGYKLVKENE